jgi:choline dehydrogenase-like flavoprotein
MADPSARTVYDTIIIGSGFGGAMAAHALVHAGQHVLMLERGEWVARGPHNWEPDGATELTPFYSTETPYRLRSGRRETVVGGYHCVGGQSVFAGGVAIRFRERDFEPERDIVGDSAAAWPYGYDTLEPYYTRAEGILGVAGTTGEDPTEPFRSAPYPQQPAGLSHTARAIAAAGGRLGLSPFRLPLAFNYSSAGGRASCIGCPTCDAYACAIGAKNDVATAVLPPLLGAGLALRPNTVAVRLVVEGGAAAGVDCADRVTGEQLTFRARRVILAAGVIGSPHLLLASGLARANPAGDAVGRFLLRHCNAMIFGFFPRPPNPENQFHKQLGFHDFYFGHPTISRPRGKLGCIQQVMAPPIGLVRQRVGQTLFPLVARGADYITGLLVIAEDEPRYENRVSLDRRRTDRFGLPGLTITHRYTARDRAARRALVRKARRILWEAGARFYYVHNIETLSHAVGTVRMGADARTSPLDEFSRFRGVANLYVIDGSFMPTSAGVNPSLTIAAHALRSAESIVGESA